MSHVSTYSQKIKDIDLFCEIAASKGYQVYKGEQHVQLYGRNQRNAVASVKIEGWRYPLAITAEGEIQYDHWGSKPGTMELLGELCQDYNQQLIIKNLPFDQIQNFYTEKIEEGRKIVLEYK